MRRLLPIMIFLLLLPIVGTVRAASPATETFGYTGMTGLVADSATAGYKFGSVATLSKAGSLTSFRFYAKGGDSAQKFVPVVYKMSSGAPSTLAVKGSEVSVPSRKS